jgi:dihydroorotate dehydrogenase (fumarate)
VEAYKDTFAEATSFFPQPSEFNLGPVEYLEQLRRIKEAVRVPVIASLNGVSVAGWLNHAALLEQAGADALELNVYQVVTDGDEDAATVEGRTLDVVRAVKAQVKIPLAVKLSPFHSSLPHLVRGLEDAGARGVVLFNRFYQPDIDPEALEVVPKLVLSDPSELLLRLRWLAVLSGRAHVDLACSGGVHGTLDGVKAVMAGAGAVQMVSAILRHGPGQITAMRDGVAEWLEEHGYDSLEQARGSMNLVRCPDPAAFERGNYLRILQSWKG